MALAVPPLSKRRYSAMTMVKLLEKINAKLSNERLTYEDLELHLDAVIDDINEKLNSVFPAFSDDPTILVYDAFPDNYIRSVVVPGVAFKFYTTDEEGISTAQTYGSEYEKGLFIMLRDYLDLVPEEFRADPVRGSYTVPEDMGYYM